MHVSLGNCAADLAVLGTEALELGNPRRVARVIGHNPPVVVLQLPQIVGLIGVWTKECTSYNISNHELIMNKECFSLSRLNGVSDVVMASMGPLKCASDSFQGA